MNKKTSSVYQACVPHLSHNIKLEADAFKNIVKIGEIISTVTSTSPFQQNFLSYQQHSSLSNTIMTFDNPREKAF